MVDQTVDGDVRRDAHTQRDADVAAGDLVANQQHTGGAGSQVRKPPPLVTSHQVVVGAIPMEPPGFLPRAGLLAELDQPGARVTVIHGATEMPGLGTTQLAAAYARAKLAEDWRLVAWISAADAGSLQAGLAAVADAAGLADSGSGRDAGDSGQAVRRLLETDGAHCLLVFDDVADPEVLRPLIPVGGASRVLIVSARRPAEGLATGVSVDVFSASEALSFLTGQTGLEDDAEAAAVATVLGHLPLALALAAPVIGRQNDGYAWYLDRLQRIPPEVSLTGEDGQPYPDGLTRALLLQMAATRAVDQTGMGTRLLEIIAVLSAAGVRRELLHVAGQEGVLASGEHRVTPDLLDRALEWLGDRSLLTFSLDGQTVTMHRLVAQVVRYGLARRRRLAAVCWAAASVLEAHALAVAKSPDRAASRGIPQQVTALLDHTAGLAGEADAELAGMLLRLRFMALYHLIELGDSAAQAIAVGEPLTTDLEWLLGPEHPDTLNSRNSLATAFLAADRAADAIRLFEQTLDVQQRMLGPDDPDTLTSQNNLANAYQDAGRVAEAIQLYERTLAARERSPGPDHPSTLNSQGNLAAAYLAAGRAVDAIALFEQTLAGRERVLGPDHPDTQTSRKNLAKAYLATGRAAEAVPLDQAPAGRPQLLRPDTQTSRKNLAPAHRDDARAAKAIRPNEQTVAAQENQAAANAAATLPPASVQRPPAHPVGQLHPDPVVGPPEEPAGYSSASEAPDSPSVDAEHDRQLVAAITAGDPASIAMAYDTYAPALYGYCHWMLQDSADAAEALQDTFVLAVATLSELSDSAKLRPWLFALARTECQRRIRPGRVSRDEVDAPADRADSGKRADAPNERAGGGQRAHEMGHSADATIRFLPVREPRREPDDATVQFRAVREPKRELGDATVQFRAVSEFDDATVVFRRVSELDDATVVFRAVSELDDATMRFRPVSEQKRELDDATMRFRPVSEQKRELDDPTMRFRPVSEQKRELDDPTITLRPVSEPTAEADGLAAVKGYLEQPELPALVRSILADLKPRQREVIQLSFWHDLYDNDLAMVLGVSWSRAHALASRARGRLEKSFGAMRTALAGREACPVVSKMLADWDGQLTGQTLDLLIWHIEQCQTCADYGRGRLRPEALTGLLPLAQLPPELREQILRCCSSSDQDAVAYRRRVVRRAESTWLAIFPRGIRRVGWDSIRANPGAAIAVAAVALWLVAAVGVTLFTFAGSS